MIQDERRGSGVGLTYHHSKKQDNQSVQGGISPLNFDSLFAPALAGMGTSFSPPHPHCISLISIISIVSFVRIHIRIPVSHHT